ncbi:MAG: hypothetical protein AB8G99_16415 [Planctomycetaceae bacterium]
MSGKPTTKKKPAPAAKSEGASAPAKPTRKKKPRPKKTDGENPFETAPVKSASAVQAAPKPMKGRLLKVVCPMCDTPGFIPKKAAGRNIRCANKKCMVPVFKAPVPKRDTADQAQPESGSALLPILAGVVALGVVGGVLFVMFGQSKPTIPSKTLPPPPVAQTKNDVERLKQERAKTDKAGPRELPLPELRGSILAELEKVADEQSNDKAFCRLMAAEALASAGKLDAALLEVEKIAKPGSAKFYQRAIALAAISEGYLRAGDSAKAAETAKQSVQAASSLPGFGKTEFDVRSTVATALALVGQLDEAAAFMAASNRNLTDSLTYRSAVASAEAFIAISHADSASRQAPPARVGSWANPMWVAVATGLSIRGKGEQALELVTRSQDELVRADMLAAIASYAASEGNTGVVQAAIVAAGKDGAAAVTRTNAAAAFGAISSQRDAAAFLTSGEKSAQTMSKPTPVVIPNARELYDYRVPKAAPLKQAALAAAELARAQAEVNGGGKEALSVAVRHAQGLAPSPNFIQARMDENLTASQLARALNISAAEADTTLNNFRSKLKALQKVATQRTDLQADILAQVASSKLGDQVWAMVAPDAKDGILKDERLADSSLPWRVALGMLKGSQAAKGREVAEQLGDSRWPTLGAELKSYVRDDFRPDVLAEVLSPDRETDPARLMPILDAAARLSKDDSGAATMFAKNIRNPTWRRQALRFVGTYLTKNGRSRELAEIAKGLDLVPPDRTAIYRGFVSGSELDPNFGSSSKTP